jgi:cytochrome b
VIDRPQRERQRAAAASPGTRRVRVWDAPTRLFHWTLALLVVAAYATWRLKWMDWHARAGYATLAAGLFRILWGLFGSETARFARFIASPGAALRHLRRALRREPDRQVGHNPAGGWMVLTLLLLVLGEALSGVYVDNDVANEGPLSELVPAAVANAITALHGLLWDVLLGAVVLHLAAIGFYATVKGQNLLTPMLTGWKPLPASFPQPALAGVLRALLLFGCSVLVTACLAAFL